MHLGIWDLDNAYVSSPSDHILPHYKASFTNHLYKKG